MTQQIDVVFLTLKALSKIQLTQKHLKWIKIFIRFYISLYKTLKKKYGLDVMDPQYFPKSVV